MQGIDTPTMALEEEDSEYELVSATVGVMRRQEMTVYKRCDYLLNQQFVNVLDGSWRQRIVEWMYGVVDHCSLRRDSVAIATFYLDLCVERGLIKSREQFQLAAMTALQIAIKLCESTVVKLQSMVALGRGIFSEEDVINMERDMLRTLNWHCHPPTPVCFLRQFVRLLPAPLSPLSRYMIAEVTRFICEISICLYKFVKYPPSVIAYAGMLIAIDRFDEVSLPVRYRHSIYSTMRQTADLDCSSSIMLEAVAELQNCLERNMSLQELMSTIDAQCHAGCGKVPPNDYGTCLGGCMNSPRDVTGMS